MNNKAIRRHPDTIATSATLQSAYEEVYTVIQLFYSEAGENSELVEYIKDIDANLANIWREAQAAIARSDKMFDTILRKDDTISELVTEIDNLKEKVAKMQTRGERNADRRAREAYNKGRFDQAVNGRR